MYYAISLHIHVYLQISGVLFRPPIYMCGFVNGIMILTQTYICFVVSALYFFFTKIVTMSFQWYVQQISNILIRFILHFIFSFYNKINTTCILKKSLLFFLLFLLFRVQGKIIVILFTRNNFFVLFWPQNSILLCLLNF